MDFLPKTRKLLNGIRRTVSHYDRNGRCVMVGHQPPAVTVNEKVGCRRKRRVEASFVEDRYVFRAGYPGDVPLRIDPDIGRRRSHFLTACENHLPAFAHAMPADQKIPTRMHAPHPVFVRPYFIHPIEYPRFERAVESGVGLFDQNPRFNAHTRGKPIPRSEKNSSRLEPSAAGRSFRGQRSDSTRPIPVPMSPASGFSGRKGVASRISQCAGHKDRERAQFVLSWTRGFD